MAASACRKCNNDFSIDEEYLGCLLECVIAGSTAPEKLHSRPCKTQNTNRICNEAAMSGRHA